jgi:hypothetical protein
VVQAPTSKKNVFYVVGKSLAYNDLLAVLYLHFTSDVALTEDDLFVLIRTDSGSKFLDDGVNIQLQLRPDLLESIFKSGGTP